MGKFETDILTDTNLRETIIFKIHLHELPALYTSVSVTCAHKDPTSFPGPHISTYLKKKRTNALEIT